MRTLICILTWLILVVPCRARIVYVDANAPQSSDGTSWAKAYRYIQDALAEAASSGNVNEIRVARGTYKPDQNSTGPNGNGDREATFQLVNGVTLRGGYAGFGKQAPNTRDLALYETILSGDLKGDDAASAKAITKNLSSFEEGRADNSYHIVTAIKCAEATILDGVIITGGSAPWRTDGGGGMMNLGSSPTLNNCTFTENISWLGGGGMFNGQNSSPTLVNCVFVRNGAGDNGGGILNDNSSPKLVGCTFAGNFARESGGGIYSNNSKPILKACIFRKNSASEGGGVCNGACKSVRLNDCVFEGNESEDYGGGMHNEDSFPNVTSCNFMKNSSIRRGGGMSNLRSDAIVTDCNFSENLVERLSGGGMYNEKSNPSISNCKFLRNRAPDGGGIENISSDGTTSNCTFIGNATSHHPNCGGAISNHESSPILTDCNFIGNSSGHGGGMENYGGSSPTLIKCNFSGNSASQAGGGVYNVYGGSSPKLKHCTFNENSAGRGAGMANFTSDYRDKKSNPILIKCVFSKNSAKSFGGGIENSHCNPKLTNCIFSENSASCGGGMYNFTSDPNISSCTFSHNRADDQGGAIANLQSNPILSDCTFTANSAIGKYRGGGAIYNSSSNPTVSNSIFVGNSGKPLGGAIHNSHWAYKGSKPTLTNCTFSGNAASHVGGIANGSYSSARLTNCIVWANADGTGSKESAQVSKGNEKLEVNYSCVQGWTGTLGGTGNIGVDPKFAIQGYWEGQPLAGGDWIAGDYHLRSQSGRCDPNSKSWVQDKVTSPCIDAGDPNGSIGPEPIPSGSRINMGAYGGTVEASKSYCGNPIVLKQLPQK